MKSTVVVVVLVYLIQIESAYNFQLESVPEPGNLLTPQIKDSLFYKGEMYPLRLPHLTDFFIQNPDRKPSQGIMTSALWRGYVATFEFKDKELKVKDIHVHLEMGRRGSQDVWLSVFEEVVPEKVDVRFDSLSGNIFLAQDNLSWLTYISSKSSQGYFLLKLRNGYLVEERWFTRAEHEQYKDDHFLAFKETTQYHKVVKSWAPGIEREEMDSAIREKLFIQQLLDSL